MNLNKNNNPEPDESEDRTPEDGRKLLVEAFDYWTGALSSFSNQAAYAIIAANWAVHSKSSFEIYWAKWSIGLSVGLITVNILMVLIIAELHDYRKTKAYNKRGWWQQEYENRRDTRWPYTKTIERTCFWFRIIKGSVPGIAGICFIWSLL